LHDFFHLLALPIEGADLGSAEAESVRRVVCAAISHHKDFEAPGYAAESVPVGLLEIAHERTPCKAPILFELADTIPALSAEPVEEQL